MAVLCNEPHKLRPWDVDELTPRQTNRLYLGCDRDRYGRVKLKPAEPNDPLDAAD